MQRSLNLSPFFFCTGKPISAARMLSSQNTGNSSPKTNLLLSGSEFWIVDSGGTCHMCNDRKLFVIFNSLAEPRDITLGDGHTVKAVGHGVVLLRISTDDVELNKCKLQDVLYVPKLSFNLLSVGAS